MSLPSPEAIKRELRRSAVSRLKGKGQWYRETQELRKWLRTAQEHPDVTMGECAELIGTTRQGAYEILKGEKR